jgi:hypothetical protein
MATASYIVANTANDDEHMRHLQNLALEGVRVLQGTANQEHETTPRRSSRQSTSQDTQQQRQQSRPGPKWWSLSTESFDMAWLRTESTTGVHDARPVASRRSAIWRRSPAITMGYVEQSVLVS